MLPRIAAQMAIRALPMRSPRRSAIAAFGSIVSGSPEAASLWGYAGKRYDPATGSYDYGFRDYEPSQGRLTTVDPIRDGSNWYAYCNADPINYVDLWGLQDIVALQQFGQQLSSSPLFVAGAAVTVFVLIDDALDGAFSDPVFEALDTVETFIEEKRRKRDKEGNPIPPASQAPE